MKHLGLGLCKDDEKIQIPKESEFHTFIISVSRDLKMFYEAQSSSMKKSMENVEMEKNLDLVLYEGENDGEDVQKNSISRQLLLSHLFLQNLVHLKSKQ